MVTECPHSPHARRRTSRPGEPSTPTVEVVDGVWHIRSHALVREVLRAGDTVQAGFNAESARDAMHAMREPILFMDGDDHRTQRSKIARYFAPKTVSARYRGLMESRADALVAEVADTLARGQSVDLSSLSLRYSVEIASAVIGLTHSDLRGMARRLERLFDMPLELAGSRRDGDEAPDQARPKSGRERVLELGRRLAAAPRTARSLSTSGAFYLADVRPAIRAHRHTPQDDVISHLLDEGYSDSEILSECLTYAAAGMVTTREFISVVTWHLLRDDDLRRHYLESAEAERYALLHEVLRLEPVVGHLYRRATADLVLVEGTRAYRVPAGAVLDLSIRAANSDPDAVGDDPLGLCPGRELPRGVRPEVDSFGDGAHRCPGNSLAIQETDVLLTRLLRLPLALPDDPRVGWVDVIAGYELRDVMLRPAA